MVDDVFYDELQAALESSDPAVAAHADAELRWRAAAHADDALVHYLVASAYDGAGWEADAMPFYERAFAIGVEHLPAGRQPEIFVQAGSTLRNLGRLDEARILLQDGMARFPAYRALPVFAALVEASAGDDRAAMALLFRVATMDEDASLGRFRRALRWYVDDLLA
ncbi:MAG TPA: tetratricopeptide repeat protein [Thermomicrobiales bacterium]|nr:tetratricopeptide repeat protein [Thermomicrobiales bacterium]